MVIVAVQEPMECPTCHAVEVYRNGYRRGTQCYKCKRCGRQFLASYRQERYSEEVKSLCLKMYQKGMGMREIERLTDIHHTTILSWIREAKLDRLQNLMADDQ